MKPLTWLALASVYFFWGTTYLAIRFGVETIPPFLMAATRFLVAGAILYAWRRLSGDPAPARREWFPTAIIGVLLLLGGNGGVVWAEQRVNSSTAALLIGSVPLWMVLIDALRPGGQRPKRLALIGVLVGFAGIVLLVGPSQVAQSGERIDLIGAGALLLAAFLWAVGSLYSRSARLPQSPLMATSMEMLTGGAALLLMGTLTGEWGRLDLAAVSARSALGLAYLIVFGSLIAFSAYTWLLRTAPTPLVASYAYINPLVAVVLGNLIAQEPLNARILLSAFVIVSSVFLINRARYTPNGHQQSASVSTPEGKPLPAPFVEGCLTDDR